MERSGLIRSLLSHRGIQARRREMRFVLDGNFIVRHDYCSVAIRLCQSARKGQNQDKLDLSVP